MTSRRNISYFSLFSFFVLLGCSFLPSKSIADGHELEGFYNPPSSFIVSPGEQGIVWRYRFGNTLPSGWTQRNFDDSSWSQSTGGFYTYSNPAAAWLIEPAEDEFVRIRSAWQPNVYLHIEGPEGTSGPTSYVSAGPIQPGWHSAMWELVDEDGQAGGRFAIRNRWQHSGDLFLYDQGGVHVNALDEGLESRWWTRTSAEFTGSNVPAGVEYINSYWGTFLSDIRGRAATAGDLESSVGGALRPNVQADTQTTPWEYSTTTDETAGEEQHTTLLARGTFQISESERDSVMFWGRWNRNIEIFINGVSAVERRQEAEGYRYLGLSDNARAALLTGGSLNQIAVVVRGDAGGSKYFDLGLVDAPEMANLPENGWASSPELQAVSDDVKAFFEQHGVSAATFAVVYDGEVVLRKSFGYKDKAMSKELSPDAIMRLASADKQVTRAAIMKLINDGVQTPAGPLTLDTPVFPLLSEYGLTPLPGVMPDVDFNEITVFELLNHFSGISELPNDSPLDGLPQSSRIDFYEDLPDSVSYGSSVFRESVRWIWSQPVTDRGAENYNSAGHMVLRYLVHEITNDNFEGYLRGEFAAPLGDQNVVIANERIGDRHPSEPWYATHKMPYERWIYLDDYLAVATSAPFLAKTLQNYDTWRQHPGAMAGTWSFSATRDSNTTTKPIYWVMITNEYAIDHDEIFWQAGTTMRNLHASAWAIGVESIGLSNHQAYASQDTSNGTVVVADQGASMALTGNRWRATNETFTVTANTYLEFDFESDGQGEIQGIALDGNVATLSSTRVFNLAGTQAWGIRDIRYSGSGVQRFSIPVGQFFTGTNMVLGLVNDNDANPSASSSKISNVRICEGPCRITLTPNQAYAGQDSSHGMVTTSGKGASITLTGNRWRATNETFTVTANTYLEFDFSSDGQGEIQGIALDANVGSLSSSRVFNLAGTQAWGIRNVRYTGGTQRFSIPVGQYFTGSNMVLGLVNDNDASPTDSTSSISNVRLCEGPCQ